MRFSVEMTYLINAALKKKGHDRMLSVFDERFFSFTEEELILIDELKIRNFYCIDELVYLKNLRKLVITGARYDEIYTPFFDKTSYKSGNLDNNPFINHIHDFSVISKLTQLQSLTIENDINLTRLDITTLSELKELVLTYNPSLVELIGLDFLTKLEKVIMCGNSLRGHLDIDRYIENTEFTNPNILDIKLYHGIINSNVNKAKALASKYRRGDTYLKFAEKNGMSNIIYNIIELDDLEAMYSRIRRYFLVRDLYSDKLTDEDRVRIIFKYLINNVRYDKDGVEQVISIYRSLMEKYGEIPESKYKKLASLHNSSLTYFDKRGNCEGFVNLMSFMLDMLGIRNMIIHCLDKRSGSSSGSNHAMIRVKLNDEWYFFDPTIDSRKPWIYYKKSLEDILESDKYLISRYQIETVCEKKYENDGTSDKEKSLCKTIC